MMFLPDVNLWLALSLEVHVHHTAAQTWYDANFRDGCVICRQVQLSYLRLISNPKVHGPDAVTLEQAWQAYDRITSHPFVNYLQEPARLDAEFRRLTHRQTFSPKLWNDAYLAAFAIAGGCHLILFDSGFNQYSGLTSTILK